MSTFTRQLPAKTDRITRAIFEHASLISRAQLEEMVRLNAELARDLAQTQHGSLWLVDEAKGQLRTEVGRGDRHSPVSALPAALCAHVDAWAAGTEQYDDMTVARLRVRD